MGFPRQEHWRGLPFSSPGDLPDPGNDPRSPALQADSLPSEPPGKFCIWLFIFFNIYTHIYIYVCVYVYIYIYIYAFFPFSCHFPNLSLFCLNFQNKSILFTQILQVALLRGIHTTIWYKNILVIYIYITLKYVNTCVSYVWASQVALVLKNLPANVGDGNRCRFDPWVGKIPWRRARQPTPVFLPGESHGQRSLAGSNPWSHTELDTTEAT